MARPSGGRTPIAIGLLVSLIAHVAVIAMASIEVPEVPSTAALTWVDTTPSEAAPEPDPPIQVVEIRPPGMSLPSGGASAASSNSAEPSTDGGGTPLVAAVRALSSAPRLDAPGQSSMELAPEAPFVDATPIVLASAPAGGADAEMRPRERRPGRGVVLKTDGSSAGGSGYAGTGQSGRFGGATGGVTIIGPGGDCITPGSSTPTGLSIPNSPTPFTGTGGQATRGRTGGGFSSIRRPR